MVNLDMTIHVTSHDMIFRLIIPAHIERQQTQFRIFVDRLRERRLIRFPFLGRVDRQPIFRKLSGSIVFLKKNAPVFQCENHF